MVYTVKILSEGTANLSPIIYDFSGSSYHYNSDFGLDVLTVTATEPMALKLVSFTAAPLCHAALLEWETATEIDNLGFNLYRSQSVGGPRSQLNQDLIPGQAPGSPLGAVYTWLDEEVETGITYYYWLEDVDVYGIATQHGPVSAMPSECPLGRLSRVPALRREITRTERKRRRAGPASGNVCDAGLPVPGSTLTCLWYPCREKQR